MIDVVGVGAEGAGALPPALRRIVDDAEIVLGSPRLLATLGEAGRGQERIPWPSPLRDGLPALLDRLGLTSPVSRPRPRVVALATGDPLLAGIGTTLLRHLGPGRVRVHPAVSAVALARAALGWPAETTQWHSLVAADAWTLRPLLTPSARLVVLCAGRATPVQVARTLLEDGWAAAALTVLGELGAPTASRWEGSPAQALSTADAPPWPDLVTLGIELPRAHPGALGRTPGLPDEAFAHEGQLTKREVRAAALAALRPQPGQRLWDLGAGSGSVAVEWCRAAAGATASAVDRRADRLDLVRANVTRLGAGGITAHEGDSLAVLPALPDPDAVFLGGGASAALVDACWARLPEGGRLVAHAVTLETEAVLVDACRRHGGELVRIAVERAQPLGRYLSWTPLRPVVQWAAVRTPEESP